MTEVTITKQERGTLWSAMRAELNNASDNLSHYSLSGEMTSRTDRDCRRVAHVARVLDRIGWSQDDDREQFSIPTADLNWAVGIADEEARVLDADDAEVDTEEFATTRSLCHRMWSRMGEAVAV